MIEKALKALIDKAVSDNSLWTTAWDTMAVPDVKPKSAVAAGKVDLEQLQLKVNKHKNNVEGSVNHEYTYKGQSTKKARKEKKLTPNAKSPKAASGRLVLDAEEMKRAERAGRFGDGHATHDNDNNINSNNNYWY